MTEQEKKVLSESLSKLYKLDSETLASLYNEAGELIDFSAILKLDAERIAKYKSDSDNQYKRGIKEGASKVEKEVKEKYEIDSDLIGVDLIDHLVVSKIEEAKVAGTKDITQHPEYIKLQVSIEKEKEKIVKEMKVEIDNLKAEHNKEKLFERVRDKALANLENRKPILPSDARKAQAWKDVYLNELRNGKYMENDGEIIVLGEDDKPLQTMHGKNITFDDFEKEIADKYFDYKAAEDRSNSGNQNNQGNVTTGFRPPKDDAEYEARLKDPKITPKERIELTNWKFKS